MSVQDTAVIIEEVFSTEILFTNQIGEGKLEVDVEATAKRAAQRLNDLGLLA